MNNYAKVDLLYRIEACWNQASPEYAGASELIAAIRHLRDCAGDEGADCGSMADMRLDAAKRRVDAALIMIESFE